MSTEYSDRNPELATLFADHLATVTARYDHALEHAGAAHAIVFSGAPHRVFMDDNDYPFKAAAHFVCWAPLYGLPLSYIVYTPGSKPTLVFYQPKDYWHVVPDEPSGYWTDSFDVRLVHDIGTVATHLPANRGDCVLIGEVTDEALAFGIERINPDVLIHSLDYARGRKTPYEIQCMRLASQRGVAGHLAARAAFENGLAEFDIHRAYCEAVSHTDPELPYANIIALNEHAAVLHYTALDRQAPSTLRSFLIDAGAQVHGYASDITRTYANGDATFSALIDRMESLQRDIVGQVKAGVDYRELHLETHRLIAGVLVESELARGSEDALLESGVTSTFYPHGLGHLLGTQVHDVGGHLASEAGDRIEPPIAHPFLRLTRVLESDMVLTVEPGLYIIDMLLNELRNTDAETLVNWSAVDAVRPYGGIRIEDNVRVLDDGQENLTRDAFSRAA
ncbi:MAG: Xaa-Pro dipeptidase [Pseudomonadota bacterium]